MSAWKQVDAHRISFLLPPSYVVRKDIQYIDVEGLDFKAGERTFGYCANCAPATGDSTCFRCRERIDGHACFIVRGSSDDGRYFTYAAWSSPRGGYLVIGAWSPDREGQKEALAAIRSVHFKPAFYKDIK